MEQLDDTVCGKRRQSKPLTWGKNVRKHRRHSGNEYINCKGQNVEAKSAPLRASCKCRHACHDITLRTRQELYKQFYEIDYNKQQSFIRGLVRPTLIARRRNSRYELPEESCRQRSFKYLLPVKTSELQVCKKTFCETFSITPRRVQLLAEKILSGKMDVGDKRGGARKKKNSDWKPKVIQHIKTFPCTESHYSRRNNPNKRFLSSDLSVAKMYRAFLEAYELINIDPKPVSRQWYHKIFNENFNLSFGQPRTDTCSLCDLLKIKLDEAVNPDEKKKAQNEIEIHHRRAEMAHKCMKEDVLDAKEHGQTLVLSFDMQQQIFIPKLTHSQMFYSRQFGMWNFGVHVENKDTAIMNMWAETEGGRGATEIGSCLYNVLTTHIIIDLMGTMPRKLVLWSDNCCSQNKNQYIIYWFKTKIRKLILIAKGYFEEIVHKFPTCGHTYLSSDRGFGLVEKKFRKEAPQVPQDVLHLLTSTRLTSPFIVVAPPPFFDWKSLAHETLNTGKLRIMQVSEIRVSSQNFGVIETRLGHSASVPWISTNVLKPGISEEFFANYNLNEKDNRRKIPEPKIKDLKEMLPFIRQAARQFYESVLADNHKQA